MNLVQTQIREEGGINPTFKVEFSGDGGEVISVVMRQNADINRENVVERARAVMLEITSGSEPQEQGNERFQI